MARGFRRVGRGYRCRLKPEEAMLIRQLAAEVAGLIAAETGDPADAGSGDLPLPPDAPTTDQGRGRAPTRPAEPAGVGETGDPASVEELERMVAIPVDPPRVPSDPVMRRLFPDAYTDADDAAEFRRFSQGDLTAGKLAALTALRESIDDRGGDVSLDDDAAALWLTGLNDLRITLGTLVGVTDDNADDLSRLPSDDPRADLFDVYDFLTYLQGSLVEAVAGW